VSTATAPHSAIGVVVLSGDLDERTFERLARSSVLAWDVETTGLDWRTDRLGTVQIRDRAGVALVQHLDQQPRLLRQLLEAPDVLKLLHHAMFDLRFMTAAWHATPVNVACTKVAAKLLRVPHAAQSLAPLVERYLQVRLDKAQQTSHWLGSNLSEAQLQYAAGDVWYLEDLMTCLRRDLEAEGLWELAQACFAHLPTRVALEIKGFEDVFVY
jgi:ribonuclease D